MRDEFILGAGQSHHLEHAFRRSPWTTEEVNILGSGDMLRDVREVIRGFSEIRPIRYSFDATAKPIAPEGKMVMAHRGHGKESFVERINDELYLNGRRIVLKDVRDRANYYTYKDLIAEEDGINATVMQFLVTVQPQLIPWKELWVGGIYFPATVFLGTETEQCIASLYWYDHWQSRGWKMEYDRVNPSHDLRYSGRVAVLSPSV
jgi:hypothetical protein